MSEETKTEETAEATEEQLTLESLDLKKPLDKMTVKELRELCIDKFSKFIVGASGMDKETLLASIKDVLGIEDEEEPKPAEEAKSKIREIKDQVKALRAEKAKAESRKAVEILRKKINRLKKQTRRLAKV
ncbi:MAG: hypothetical protein ACNI3A_15070 [Desulfovibrio sp.]|uniref:hypothetical protein n=1 Tax=Desulfovibrio sp. 7SRBS1 TaxID=3378064 RepID=UPI003B3BF96D